MRLLSSASFFKINFIQIRSFRNTFKSLRVPNGLDPDQNQHYAGPVWFQTVCKGYGQATEFAAGKERVEFSSFCENSKHILNSVLPRETIQT